MIHVGFTGTRYGCKPEQRVSLSVLMRDYSPINTVAHHGDCVGADAQFHEQAHVRGWNIAIHPPVDNAHRAFCGFYTSMDAPQPHMKRNKAIVAAADVMIACPFDMVEQTKGGTWKTIGFTRNAGKPLAIVWPDGSVTKERWP